MKKLKEKQAKRKITRAEEEKKMAERKKQEEERRIREIEEKKQRDIEEKRQRLEEAEKKRQAMMQALKDQSKTKGPNFTITKRDASVGFYNTIILILFWLSIFIVQHQRRSTWKKQDQGTTGRREKDLSVHSYQTFGSRWPQCG